MNNQQPTRIKVYDCDPGGNNTYIVDGRGIERKDYSYFDGLLRKARHFEQGGFVEQSTASNAVLRLHLAGEEFCGNAIRCFGAVIVQDYLANRELAPIADYSLIANVSGEFRFFVEASGASELLRIQCSLVDSGYLVKTQIPIEKEPSSIFDDTLVFQGNNIDVRIVKMSGIVHLLIDESCLPFPANPEEQSVLMKYAIKQFQLEPWPAVGLIWHSISGSQLSINPVVWVPKVKTCIYESSCGSGAVALTLSKLLEQDAQMGIYDVGQPAGQSIRVMVSRSVETGDFLEATIEGRVCIRPAWLLNRGEAQ